MTTVRTVFGVFFASFLLIASFVSAQTINISPGKTNIAIGEQFTVRVSVSSPDQAINAVSASLGYPATLSVVSIDKTDSIVDFWTEEPRVVGGKIVFEGVALSPGYQGGRGVLFTVTFSGKREGSAQLTLTNASLLANDGLGSNILKSLGTALITIRSDIQTLTPAISSGEPGKAYALPVITEYSNLIGAKEGVFLRGKGEPGAVTKIVFKDATFRSIGEQFIASLQTRKQTLNEVLVKNDPVDGTFEYSSPPNLVAGAYNATPFLVEEKTSTEKPGLGVQLFVNDSALVRGLVVLVNILALLIPIVGLVVLIYFIPWYSFRRMRVIKRRLGLEEERLELSSHNIKRTDSVSEHATQEMLSSSETK